MIVSSFFFFNDTATTEIYTLSLHDALPICGSEDRRPRARGGAAARGRSAPCRRTSAGPAGRATPDGRGTACVRRRRSPLDRKSTRLNSSHANISYAVFCLKKKTITTLILTV